LKMVLPEVRDIYPTLACIEISHQNIPVAVTLRFVVVTIIIPTFLPRHLATSSYRIVVVGIFALDREKLIVLW